MFQRRKPTYSYYFHKERTPQSYQIRLRYFQYLKPLHLKPLHLKPLLKAVTYVIFDTLRGP
jgi:hypothetical protein